MVPYLDCAATTPMEPEVIEIMLKYMTEEFGNAGSRTHEYGLRAKKAVELARSQVADIVAADPDEIVFTSGATESNNLAILGLAPYAERTRKKHIVTTAIEHKAVLEPVAHLEKKGFEVTRIMPTRDGFVLAEDVLAAVRDDTVLVSVMHANNETGILQPIEAIAAGLSSYKTYLHVDAAQTFGKLIGPLRNERIDMISASAHKLYGPKGVGVLVTRRREFRRPPLEPLMFGGGQERGLRPGTAPVACLAGFGEAARLALVNGDARLKKLKAVEGRVRAIAELVGFSVLPISTPRIPTTQSLWRADIDDETMIIALKERIAVANGAACSSARYEPSHVARAMGRGGWGVLRVSWSHRVSEQELNELEKSLGMLAELAGV
jgi:cysteine desulfurase